MVAVQHRNTKSFDKTLCVWLSAGRSVGEMAHKRCEGMRSRGQVVG